MDDYGQDEKLGDMYTPNKLLEMTNLHQNSGLVGEHEQEKLLNC